MAESGRGGLCVSSNKADWLVSGTPEDDMNLTSTLVFQCLLYAQCDCAAAL